MNSALIQSLKDKLRTHGTARWPTPGVHSGVAAIDELTGPGGLARGAIHEVLSPTRRNVPRLFALLLARAAMKSGAIVWCCEKEEDTGTWYPPAAAALGIPADRLILLRPGDAKQTLWAVAECLRCKGVGVTIARLRGKLTTLDARRMQLAAESGGGIGVLLRTIPLGVLAGSQSAHDSSISVHDISGSPKSSTLALGPTPSRAPSTRSSDSHYAAATRWLVEPAPGELHLQRWNVTLLHGGSRAFDSHAGRIDSKFALEVHRETHAVTTGRFIRALPFQANALHPPQKLADQPAQAKTVRAAG